MAKSMASLDLLEENNSICMFFLETITRTPQFLAKQSCPTQTEQTKNMSSICRPSLAGATRAHHHDVQALHTPQRNSHLHWHRFNALGPMNRPINIHKHRSSQPSLLQNLPKNHRTPPYSLIVHSFNRMCAKMTRLVRIEQTR